jgi:hypothetical protein
MKKLLMVLLVFTLTLSLSSCKKHDSEGFNESLMHALGMFGSSKTNLEIDSISYVYFGADYEQTRVVFYIFAIQYTQEGDRTDRFALLFTQKYNNEMNYSIENHDAYENMMTNFNEYVRVFKNNPLELPYENTKLVTSKLTARQVDSYVEKALGK